MDQNSRDFLILSYVLSKLDSNSHPALSSQFEQTLLTQFPHLKNPKVLASMFQVMPTNITETHSFRRTLGPRPDSSAVSVARAKIDDIQSKLRKASQETQSGVLIDGSIDRDDKEKELRQEVEKELQIYKAVLTLEDMHESCGKELRGLEERLVEVYWSDMAELDKDCEGEVNEELFGILKEAEDGKVVERVELSGCQLKFLPEAFGTLHWLISLNLSHNQLEVIPDSIIRLKNLEELDVSSNLLVSLPDSIGLLLNLRVLNASRNQLNALPESIAGCSSLMELDVSFNNLMRLPTNIGYRLVNLVKLSIGLNKIHFLPTSICEMRLLTYLDVHFNELSGLSHSIGRLANLEILNLSSNFSDLKDLPETIGDLTNLRELDLSNNQIKALPVTIVRLKKLTKLNLDQNPLTHPPIEIVNQGVEVVREYMEKRWLNIIEEEQQKSMLEAKRQEPQTGWLAWGASLLNQAVYGVSQNVSSYFGAGKVLEDQWLDQQL